MANPARLQQPKFVGVEPAAGGAVAAPQQLYFAFLSYSHQDSGMADWLHKQLERFVVPKSLAGRLTKNGIVPKRLIPIFRDRGELAASGDLGAEIREALSESRYLIVLCSPAAAKSRWTNAEIDAFKRVRPDGLVLAAIADGEPFASDIPGREDEECLPAALKVHYDDKGQPTTRRAEPLAADFREGGDGRRLGLLKLIAGMLGIGLDELVQREARRRQRRLAMVAAASLAGMAITSGLAVVAIEARDAAQDQRREAEGLVTFMVGDLRAKLEPVGRLDALDGVGSRVLAYYQKQGTSDLSNAALSKRSRALSMMAEVATARGDLPGALGLYREAAAGTAESIRRDPRDPQRIFDHAQNVFYVGAIAHQRGDKRGAETAIRQYKQLALRMVSLEPNNGKWRMEVQNADTNLGIMLYEQRRFTEAAAELEQALKSIEALAAAEPANGEYRKSLVESLAWAAEAHTEGQLEKAIAERERLVQLLHQSFASFRDVSYRLRLISAEANLGNLYAARGRLDLAITHLRIAVHEADRLTPIEPNNTMWHEFAFRARLNLAQYALLSGRADEAATQVNAGCKTVERLLAIDARMPKWRAGLRDCWMMRALLALHASSKAEALRSAQQAVNVAQSARSGDAAADGFTLAKTYRLLGDVQRGLGNHSDAVAAWTNAAATIPTNLTESAREMREHVLILRRLGRIGETHPLENRLRATGYRELEFGAL